MAKAKFRMIHTNFWSDGKVSEEMTPEDKFFMLYLLTNEHTTQTGIYQITKKKIAFDMGYSMETIGALLERFISYHKSIVYNADTRELAIVNWGKYNLTRAGKPMEDCVKSELKLVEDVSLIEIVGKHVESPQLKAIYDTYTIRDTSRGQEEEEEEEEEEEDKKVKTNVQSEIERDFDEFYSHYPIKKGKANAVKAYAKARKNKHSHETIMNGLMDYKQELQAKGTDKQFIKQPATFLNGEHFNDEYDFTPAFNNNIQQPQTFRFGGIAYGEAASGNDSRFNGYSVPKQIEG